MASLRPASDGPAELVVRPEDARPADRHPKNAILADVVDSAFQGRCWRVTLDVGGDVIRVDWPTRLVPGARLQFSLPPDRYVTIVA